MCTEKIVNAKGTIFDIRRTSYNDGPGIRTTIFLKGCNMNCAWCHNPESINKKIELMFDPKKCLYCRLCEKVCDKNVHIFTDSKHILERESCDACGKCTEKCPSKASEICGKIISVKEAIEIVKKDNFFYMTSNGGMTISGGEPLVQKEFTFALLYFAKLYSINTIVDTNGHWIWNDIEEMLPFIDSFRYDLKLMDNDRHKLYTGVSNNKILENLKKLSHLNKEVVVTIPIVPEVNDTDENIKSTVTFLKSLPRLPKVQLLQYHSLYASKTKKLGRRRKVFASKTDINRIKSYFINEKIELYEN